MRHSLDQIGSRVHAPAGHTVELWNFNRGQSIRPSKRNSMRHSLDQIGDRVNAPAEDTAYIDQIGDKVHAAPGDTVEILNSNGRQSTRHTRRTEDDTPKEDMFQKSDR